MSKIGNGVADFVDKVPGAGVISGALRAGAGVGDALVNGGKALVGGYGGLNGAIDAARDGLSSASDAAKALTFG